VSKRGQGTAIGARISRGGQSGAVLLVCLIILVMISLAGIVSIMTSNADFDDADGELNQTAPFDVAGSGLEEAAAAVISCYRTTGNPPDPLPSGSTTEGDYLCRYQVVAEGPAESRVLRKGAYNGLYGLVRTLSLESIGFHNRRQSAAVLEMTIEESLIPLFQFAVFYENDLEISPDLDMTLAGRVHSNGNIYLQSKSNLFILSYLTSGGNIFHGSKSGGGQELLSGNIYITDDDGKYRNMRNVDGTFLDSSDPDWVNGSLSRWDGTVEDKYNGISELYMPVVCDGPTTDLIDRSDNNSDSYENKAGLKFVDGRTLFRRDDGTWKDVTSILLSSGVISSGVFHDGRENRDVASLDIDMGALAGSGYYPTNGIVYVSGPAAPGTLNAVRLANASRLPSGLTVVTDNPLYTVGDFNIINKQPAALMADAVTVLSNNWEDAESWHGPGSGKATATRINASIIAGSTETGADGQGYNGGFENLLRLLEDWSGIVFSWRGSATSLWNSRQATGVWRSEDYYEDPIRDWAFDPDLLDPDRLPPGTPRINIVHRVSWRQSVINNYGRYAGGGLVTF
jgi:hypothetical protein